MCHVENFAGRVAQVVKRGRGGWVSDGFSGMAEFLRGLRGGKAGVWDFGGVKKRRREEKWNRVVNIEERWEKARREWESETQEGAKEKVWQNANWSDFNRAFKKRMQKWLIIIM